MTYDSDKTEAIIEELRACVRRRDLKAAAKLLRHADGGGRLRRDPGLIAALRKELGDRGVRELVAHLAQDPCPYCASGRERCDECNGRGHFDGSTVCEPCAGLGLRRCPFCNGTAFAGYDFVPTGLRIEVMRSRLRIAGELIEPEANRTPTRDAAPRDLVRQIVQLDRGRGVLANAVEQARLHAEGSAGGRSVLPRKELVQVERSARAQNDRAEAALRARLKRLAGHYAARTGNGPAHPALAAARAKVFARLAEGRGMDASALRTPQALRRESARTDA